MSVKLNASLISAWRSFYTTAAGLLVGWLTLASSVQITANNVTAPAISDPAHLWVFFQNTWFSFMLANLVTPILKGVTKGIQTPNPPTENDK